jgi:hypothetical protein
MSLKDEELALTPPFKIGMGDKYRDFSNTTLVPIVIGSLITRAS